MQLRNSRGHTLQCSHYLPSSIPEDTSLPCVIYCHGNRYLHIVEHSTLEKVPESQSFTALILDMFLISDNLSYLYSLR